MSPWNAAAARRIKESIERNIVLMLLMFTTRGGHSRRPLSAFSIACEVPIVMTLHNYRLLCVNAQLFREGGPCEDCVGTHPWRGVRHRCYRESYLASAISAAAIQSNRWLKTWQKADLLLALTEFARTRFLSAGLPPDRVHIKSNFVDDPGPRRCAAASSRTVLFVGRLSEEKGIAQLLDVWAAAKLENLTLSIVGDGPMRSSIEARAPANVQFLGRLPGNEVEELMLSSRALIFPSIWYEGQPMVLLEALAAALPVVASEIGGVPETIADPGAGLLADPSDPASWTRAISRLEDDARVDRGKRFGARCF